MNEGILSSKQVGVPIVLCPQTGKMLSLFKGNYPTFLKMNQLELMQGHALAVHHESSF